MTNVLSTVEIQSKIATWRMKAAEGTLSLDDCREAVAFLRQGRMAAASSTPAAKRKAAIAAIPSAEEMLGDLEGL